MSRANLFPELMRAFFYEWLVEQRNASIHTVRSYRDTWRLFLRFVAQRAGKKVAMITLADLAASEVAGFLRHAEHERGGTIGTRNCRLAAIRSFFNFVATRDPASIAQCVEIHNIPVKRAPVSEPCYLGSQRWRGCGGGLHIGRELEPDARGAKRLAVAVDEHPLVLGLAAAAPAAI
jgi:hypothetical protein